MKALFGFLSLLIVLAVVASVGRKQLDSLAAVGTRVKGLVADAPATTPRAPRDGAVVAVPGGMPGATAAPPAEGSVPAQARQIQTDVLNATSRAYQESLDRSRRADP